MSKIATFYREFFIILILVVVFFGLFGTLNDRFIQLITDIANNKLLESSLLFQILLGFQGLGLLGFILIAYRNGIPLKSRRGNKLSKKVISIIVPISAALILIPYFVLLFL